MEHSTKLFGKFVKYIFYVPRRSFWGKILLCQKKSVIFKIGRKYFQKFDGVFSAGLSKLQFTCPQERFGGNFFETDFSPLLIFERKSFGFLADFFRQVCQICIPRVHRNCLRNVVCIRNLFFLLLNIRALTIRTFDEMFSAMLIKLHSLSLREQFAEKNFFQNFLFSINFGLSTEYFRIFDESIRLDRQIAVYEPRVVNFLF